MSKNISLIGAPTDIGAGARGASMGPEALRVAGIRKTLEGHGLTVVDRGNLTGPSNPWLPPVDGYRHLPEVVAWNESVHAAVHAELRHGHLPILLGGDHCLAIGSISAGLPSCRSTLHHSGGRSSTASGQHRSARRTGAKARYLVAGWVSIVMVVPHGGNDTQLRQKQTARCVS